MLIWGIRCKVSGRSALKSELTHVRTLHRKSPPRDFLRTLRSQPIWKHDHRDGTSVARNIPRGSHAHTQVSESKRWPASPPRRYRIPHYPWTTHLHFLGSTPRPRV